MTIDLIAFDADDTLWHNEHNYSNTKEKLAKLLSGELDSQKIMDMVDETEAINLQYYGYGIKSFTLSLIETAVKVKGNRLTVQDVEAIIKYAKKMLTEDVRLIAGASEIMREMAKSYELMIITKGELSEQTRKVEFSGLKEFFKWVEIVGDKTTDMYKSLFKKFDISPERFLMVGNSLRSDIIPVLENGGYAVYVPYENTWRHELDVDFSQLRGNYFEIEHLGDLPALLKIIDNS